MNGRTLIFLFATAILIVPRFARADDDVVQTVINLVSDKDKDVRAIGLEQVRDEAKGAEATRRFAALLPKLAPEAQVGLLGALVGRGDAAAKPAVLELLKSSQGEVRATAIRAIGPLGDGSDVPKLIALLGDEKSQKDAVAALTLLHGDGVNAALCSPLKSAVTPVRVAVVKLLVARHSIDSVPTLLTASKDNDAKVRAAALEALGQLAGPELIAKLAREILDAKDDKSREEAEISLALIARRDPKNTDPALPLLKMMNAMTENEINTLLPALGRVGGRSALQRVKAAFASADGDRARIAAAATVLCNWPDGSVAPLLVDMIIAAKVPDGKSRSSTL